MTCRLLLLALFIAATVLSAEFAAAAVTAERSKDGAIVKIDEQPFTEYLVASGTKPVLWPIIGPTGKPVTRAYPMAEVPEEKVRDHVHHRSLWFTHGDVNGVDFWGESKTKGGTIKHREFTKVEGGKTAVIGTVNDWLAPDGKKVCEDRRTLRFGTDGDARWIDFDITIEASEGPVTFGDTKEGMFGVRVAESMRVDSKKGGRIVNSEGQTDNDAWGKPAAWVDYYGPVDGQTVGIAIFNHPGSFRFPTHWHVRTYGLFAANPFGLHDFPDGKDKNGAHTIPAGKSMTLRYRVFLHRGDEKKGKVAEAFAAYSKDVK
jgi:hypothetical protein